MENRTWKATTAGVLNIVAGIVSLFAGIDLIVGIGIVTKLTGSLMNIPGFMEVFFLVGIYVILAGIILGIIAIAGGVFAFAIIGKGKFERGCIGHEGSAHLGWSPRRIEDSPAGGAYNTNSNTS